MDEHAVLAKCYFNQPVQCIAPHCIMPWLHVQLLHATRCNSCMQ